MRTNLRRPDSSLPVEVIVADKTTALAVGRIIGCQKIERLGQIEIQQSVEKAKPYTKAEKDLRYHFKKARLALFSEKAGQQELRPSPSLKRKGRQIHNDATSNQVSKRTSKANDNEAA